MNWREATNAQLYEIAFNDTGCSLEHKRAAGQEILRRRKKPRHKAGDMKARWHRV